MADFPLLNEASLVMIPGATKEGKVYSQVPTDGSGDFTFTRSTSATRVNEAGNIEKGYENTLLQSNNWAQSDSQYEITGGEAGYDGTNDAWLVNKLAAAYFGKGGVSISSVATISIYAKAGSLDKLLVFFSGESATFDLTNVTAVKSGGATIAQSIELVSGTTDWYRCSLVINVTSSGNLLIKPLNSSNQDVTGTIYIQDAQINQGLVAYPYLETTTAPVYGGLQADQPRLDYKDATCPSLLLEPSRTNGFNHSEALYQLPVKSGVSWEDNVTTSPEGLNNAGKLTEGTGFQYLGQSSFPSGNRVISVFAKYDSSLTRICLGQYITTNQVANAVFNIQAGTILSETTGSSNIMILEDAGVEDYGNGWRRYWVSISGTSGIAYVAPSGSDTISFVPNYTGSSQHCFLYGLQYEQDATYPTSYIPTYGSAESRGGDVLGNSNDISGLFNDNEGTLYFETNDTIFKGEASNKNFFGLTESSSNNYFRFRGANSNILAQAGGFSTIIYFNPSGATFTKYLYKWDGTNVKLFIDGVERGSASQTATFNPNSFRIGFNFGFVSNTKQLSLFSAALTDTECIALTTL